MASYAIVFARLQAQAFIMDDGATTMDCRAAIAKALLIQ
jgi:hypothetical protein